MAKILISTYSGYGNYFAMRLLKERNKVDIYYNGLKSHPERFALEGLVPEPFFEKPSWSKYDLVLFDITGKEKLAEEAKKETAVLGDGDFQKAAEEDRLEGIQLMQQAGINVPFYEVFDDLKEAKSFIKKTKKRYVFKPFGGQNQETASTYASKSDEDLLKYLDKLGELAKGMKFILQEFKDGTEISCEGWFNGEEFFLINATLEEKKFMDNGLGPNTGCSGNLIFMLDDLNPPAIFQQGVGKMKDFLQAINYRGMIDLNSIVTASEFYGLEWTPRFGYDASVTLFKLISSDLSDFLGSIAVGNRPNYQIRNPFAASVRLSIPPYPSEILGKHPSGVPIDGLQDEPDLEYDYYLYDVGMDGDDMLTVGINGFLMAPISSSDGINDAWNKVYNKVNKIHVPNLQYRNDLPSKTLDRYRILSEQGWLR